jgi:hypothetical protein
MMRIPHLAISHMLNRLFCSHPKSQVKFDDKHTLICHNCNATWPISASLVEARGVFADIQKRLEQKAEHKRLVELGTAYLNDRRYNRGA